MEVEQSELWQQATERAKKLSEFQCNIVELLPKCRKQLPTSFKELEKPSAQNSFLDHILLRSYYAFSTSVWQKLEIRNEELAKYSGCNKIKELKANDALQTMLCVLDQFPFDAIFDISISSLKRIDDLKDVLIVERIPVYETWDYRDIIGTIKTSGLVHEGLWKSVVESLDPIGSNLKELLDDDTMVRVY